MSLRAELFSDMDGQTKEKEFSRLLSLKMSFAASQKQNTAISAPAEPRLFARLLLPAEWERHEATWLAWPHDESTWPGCLEQAEEAVCQFAHVARTQIAGLADKVKNDEVIAQAVHLGEFQYHLALFARQKPFPA